MNSTHLSTELDTNSTSMCYQILSYWCQAALLGYNEQMTNSRMGLIELNWDTTLTV